LKSIDSKHANMLLFHFKTPKILAIFLMILITKLATAQGNIYFGEKEIIPKIPPKGERMRIIIVSDATNEIDDIWAIALAILSPERFDIEGFVGSNYDHTHNGVGPKSIDMSVAEIQNILAKAGMKGKYPVYPGAHPMQYEFAPGGSEGVDFIIEKALTGSPENPLWIVGLGSSTDLASAYLKEPRIKDRVVMFWHARTEQTWPYRAHNYNIKGDMHAARMMFHAPFPLVLFDTGTHLTAGTLKETEENVKPYGELGEYMYNYRLKSDYYKSTTKGYFDLGDIAVLIDPGLGKWEETFCPTVTPYMDYNFYKTNGKVLRCYDVDRDKTFELLYRKLKENHEKVKTQN
jgi:inosine-uridine nucleoside N-ribohydrolase